MLIQKVIKVVPITIIKNTDDRHARLGFIRDVSITHNVIIGIKNLYSLL